MFGIYIIICPTITRFHRSLLVRVSFIQAGDPGSRRCLVYFVIFFIFSLMNAHLLYYPRLLPFISRSRTLILRFSTIFFHDSPAFSLIFMMFMPSNDRFTAKIMILCLQFRKIKLFVKNPIFWTNRGKTPR